MGRMVGAKDVQVPALMSFSAKSLIHVRKRSVQKSSTAARTHWLSLMIPGGECRSIMDAYEIRFQPQAKFSKKNFVPRPMTTSSLPRPTSDVGITFGYNRESYDRVTCMEVV
jgi:hypothetical protein